MTSTHANRFGYSDVEPHEIVRRIGEKTLEIRAMDAKRDPAWKMNFIPGGFLGHVVNQNEQAWIITSDETRRIVRIRLRKNGQWYDANGNRYGLSDKPIRFYDYNF